MSRVEVTINNAGEVEIEVHGVKGSGCAALTKAIEQSIGSTVSDRKKPEFVQEVGQGNQAKASQ